MSIERGTSNLTGLPGNSFVQHHIPKDKLIAGDLSGKKAVQVDERTIIYVPATATEQECENRKQAYLTHLETYR